MAMNQVQFQRRLPLPQLLQHYGTEEQYVSALGNGVSCSHACSCTQMPAPGSRMASRLERSRGWIMKQAPSAWIAQEEARDRLTQEALAEVDAGRVIDHQAVQAWADGLGTDQPRPVPC